MLIKCPECGKEISDKAPAYIHCGYPLSGEGSESYTAAEQMEDDGTTYNVIIYRFQNEKGRAYSGVQKALDCKTRVAINIVEKIPSFIKKDVPLDEANQMKKDAESFGCLIALEPYNEDQDDMALLQKHKSDQVWCPACGSLSVTAGQRGYKITTGFIGSGKTVNRCANCGHTWKP